MKIKVEFEIELPAEGEQATSDEIHDWIEFNIGANGSLPLSNPLSDWELPCGRVFNVRTERQP